MHAREPLVVSLSLVGLLVTGLCGCQRKVAPIASPPVPVVPVSHPVKDTVTDFADFTGRLNAVESVDVRARVSGYLVQMPFKEGADVKKGDMLFEIDPRPYKAQLDQAQGQVNLYQAQLALARTNYARDREVAKTPGAVSAQQLDQDQAAIDEADAAVKAFQASLEVARLNLSFTKVTSPIDGQVSRYFLTLGNLVVQDQTLLTTVVSLDPMYVYFDVDEGTLLRVRRAINEGKIERYQKGKIPVYVGLQGETGFPREGVVNFVNNQVNPNTGSISVRGELPNPLPAKGVRVLSAGMFVRVRLPIGRPHPALLVIDRAIGSDQGLKYVYVIGPQNVVEQRFVTTGSLQNNGLRVISTGLKPDEVVAVGALPQIRPRMAVKTQVIPMPTFTEAGQAQSQTAGGSGPKSMPGGPAK